MSGYSVTPISVSNRVNTGSYDLNSINPITLDNTVHAISGNTGYVYPTNSASNISLNFDTSGISSGINSMISAINQIQDVIRSNNAAAIQAAADQRDWSERVAQQSYSFNAAEAAKNRDWQEMMSNTAHQREVNDLKAAGLNPVLSAMGGNGASVTSGATASGSIPSGSSANLDQSGALALVNLLGSFLTAQTNLQMADLSARTNEAVADKYAAVDQLVAELGRQNVLDQTAASRYSSEMSYLASQVSAGAIVSSADISRAASQYVADHNLEGTKYAYDVQKEIARLNNDEQFKRLNTSNEFEEYMKKYYPQTSAGLIGSVAGLSADNGVYTKISNLLTKINSRLNGFSNTSGKY